MNILKLIVVLVFMIFCQLCNAAYLIPSAIDTQLNASYVLIIKEDGIKPSTCYIDDGKNKYTIDLVHQGVKPEPHKRNTDIVNNIEDSNIITSLGDGICGFKMDKVSKTTSEEWTLTIIDEKGKNYTKSGYVIIRDASTKYEKKMVKIGDPIYINCADTNKMINYCEIYHPNGEVVFSGINTCTFQLKLTKSTDFGTWKCLLSYKSNMQAVESYVELIQTEFNIINTWHNETETRVNLGCSVSNPTQEYKHFRSVTNYCVMVRPDGKQFNLFPGLATARYTTLNTNVSKATPVCAMEIAKPLANNEWGIWRCELHSAGYKNAIGGFITLSTRSNRIIRSVPGAEAQVPKDKFLHVNSTMSVSCRVPYSSSYCYMRGPDSVLYPINDDRSTTLGLCKFTKEKVTISDNGTWYCGFAKKTGEPDDTYKFQIYVAETLTVRPESHMVEARSEGGANLKCTTNGIGGYPLQYCRFLSPDGHMYQITPEDKSKDRIVYDGRGLAYGDCGIKIREVQLSDFGTWSCITRIGSHFTQEEVYTNINLTLNNNLSLASVLGITFGASIVVVGGSVFGIRRWKKRRSASRVPNERFARNISNRSSNSSHSSSTSNVAFNINSRQSIHDNNYDTISNTSIRYRVN